MSEQDYKDWKDLQELKLPQKLNPNRHRNRFFSREEMQKIE